MLPLDASSPSLARTFVRANSCPAHDLEVLDESLLLVTELVTNSIKHGEAPVLLAIECAEASLTIQVRDGSPVEPVQRPAGEQDEAGRGLALLELLSDAWGVEPVVDERGTGKTVWFRLRPSVPPYSAAAPATGYPADPR